MSRKADHIFNSRFVACPHFAAVLCLIVIAVVPASAGEHNRLFGCVTDTNGHPVLRAKVVASRWQDPGLFSTKREWKAEADKSTGCYEMRNLPYGDYEVALGNSGFLEHLGPPQEFVQFGENGSAEANLTSDFPTRAKLMAGVRNVLGNFSTGFTSLRRNQISTDKELWYYRGLEGWYIAPVLPGFSTCSTGPFRGDAYYKCVLRYMKGAEFSKSMHTKLVDFIGSAIASHFPDLGPAQIGTCSTQKQFLGFFCTQQTEWRERRGYVTLATYSHRDEYYIEFTVLAIGVSTNTSSNSTYERPNSFRWRVELPPENNYFDLESLSDVVLHLNYTAREGGEKLRTKATEAVECSLPGAGWCLFDLRHDFSGTWELFR